MPRILLTDGWTRKTLSAVRSLGEKGIEVHIASHKRLSPALYSKFCTRFYITSHPVSEPVKYKAELLNILKNNQFDAIFPFEEATIELILNNEKEFATYTRFLLPSKQSYETASNKKLTLDLAEKLNIPHPRTRTITSKKDLDSLGNFNEQLVIKPAVSSGSRGIHYLNSIKEAEPIIDDLLERYNTLLIQERIPKEGTGCGCAVLCKEGKVIAKFTYERVREFPVSGGPSTVRVSKKNELIETYSTQLMNALDWDGVAMIEFKLDPKTGLPKLLEINPRFWGSMDLAYESGINFPYLLYQLIIGKEEIKEPTQTDGVLSRWLIPGDVANFIFSENRFSQEPSFFSFKRYVYDDFKKGDSKGNMAVIICGLLSVFDLENWKLGIFRK
jgi:predicted ATP-grasp superfamily ATP-dependent carboligase